MSRYEHIGSFETVGELRKILDNYGDKVEVGFINQPMQDVYCRIESGVIWIGFQEPPQVEMRDSSRKTT